MLANELMIGDIILNNGNIYQIVHPGHMDEVDNYPDRFAPVKLTEPILIKSGFHQESNGVYTKKELRIKKLCNGQFQLCQNNLDPFGESFDSVHKLQHILDIYGYPKDVKL